MKALPHWVGEFPCRGQVAPQSALQQNVEEAGVRCQVSRPCDGCWNWTVFIWYRTHGLSFLARTFMESAMMRLSQLFGIAMTMGALAGAVACGSSDIAAVNVQGENSSVSANMGQEISVTLQNIGPGTYTAPPEISSPIIEFVAVTDGDVAVPAGVTQVFHFVRCRRGRRWSFFETPRLERLCRIRSRCSRRIVFRA